MVVLFKQGPEVGDEAAAGVVEALAVEGQLGVVDGDHAFIPEAVVPHLLEEAVAHLEGFVVLQQMLQVAAVGLREDAVDEATAHVAAAGDDLLVGRRHHDEWQLANMFSQCLVRLLVPAHLLAFPAAEDAACHVVAIVAVDGEEVVAHAYVLHVDGIKVAFAEREVVDGVEEVGLPRPVVADEAVDIAAEGNVGFGIVLEVGQYQSFQGHNS